MKLFLFFTLWFSTCFITCASARGPISDTLATNNASKSLIILDNNEIRIIGKFITLADWVEADKTVEVGKIYQTLEKLNHSTITVR